VVFGIHIFERLRAPRVAVAILRLLAGIGIGGEWAMGGTFVAEEWPEHRRRMGAGFMHTGYYVGIFLAALANYGIGSHYGWRAMFIVGGVCRRCCWRGFGTG
jgi:MFS family permease